MYLRINSLRRVEGKGRLIEDGDHAP
eukprot:COSAG02_NODE_57717_length_279_cov_1.633333_1_plen_25_part_01